MTSWKTVRIGLCGIRLKRSPRLQPLDDPESIRKGYELGDDVVSDIPVGLFQLLWPFGVIRSPNYTYLPGRSRENVKMHSAE